MLEGDSVPSTEKTASISSPGRARTETVRTRIKICGITRPEDAAAAVASGADAVGLIFYPPSPRSVDVSTAGSIVAGLPAFTTIVAVFVDPDVDVVRSVLSKVRVSLIQFHGDENDEFCADFPVPYIKSLRMSDDADPAQYATLYPNALGLLLDGYAVDRYGGTGSQFLWERARSCQDKPVIIAGGLNAGNVSEALLRSGAFAVDVSSGVERQPAIKDHDKISALCAAVVDHDRQLLDGSHG